MIKENKRNVFGIISILCFITWINEMIFLKPDTSINIAIVINTVIVAFIFLCIAVHFHMKQTK